MRPALAELVIEALTPELKSAIERRGWRFGPSGDLIKRQGRPPEARAAWAAALLAENHLARRGATPAKARSLATSLAAALLGRRAIESPEFYRVRRRMGAPDPNALATAISKRYEKWLSQHAMQLRDPIPPPEQIALRLSWRERHRPLAQFVGMYGAEKFARLILEEVPDEFWTPFSRMESPRIAQAQNPERAKGAVGQVPGASGGPQNPRAGVSVQRRGR